mmetsp:Transcript_33746/g.81773  ORF Transcript_33746/g.81773 Transcript_33746/m.81773 type:complete len:146 (+) Transcript_33746:300-737(+)
MIFRWVGVLGDVWGMSGARSMSVPTTNMSLQLLRRRGHVKPLPPFAHAVERAIIVPGWRAQNTSVIKRSSRYHRPSAAAVLLAALAEFSFAVDKLPAAVAFATFGSDSCPAVDRILLRIHSLVEVAVHNLQLQTDFRLVAQHQQT